MAGLAESAQAIRRDRARRGAGVNPRGVAQSGSELSSGGVAMKWRVKLCQMCVDKFYFVEHVCLELPSVQDGGPSAYKELHTVRDQHLYFSPASIAGRGITVHTS